MYKDFDLGVVIPVRLGSSRVSRKALLPVGEEKLSLLAWKIRQIKKVISPEAIYVSTEAPELMDVARSEGVHVIERDEYLADGHKASFSEVIVGVVKDIPHDHVAWVTCVVPLMSPQEYLQGFQEYRNHVVPSETDWDSLVAVNLLKEYFWDDNGAINYSATKDHTISQDLPNIYRVTNGLYMAPKKLMLEKEYILGQKPYKSIVSKIAGVDIDEQEDYEIARTLTGIYQSNMHKHSAKRMVFLDFDGVVFDSAVEAYAIAMVTSGKARSLAEVDPDSEYGRRFLKQRHHIGPAWNYFYLLEAFDMNVDENFDSFLPAQAGEEAKEFQSVFFNTRKQLRSSSWEEWLRLNKLYAGSEGFLKLIEGNENVVIVTTKDRGTVEALLELHGVKRKVEIFDAKDYERLGCKSKIIHEIMTDRGVESAAFVDDSAKHIAKCEWVPNLELLHAKWGYVAPSAKADNKDEVLQKLILTLQR